MKSLSVFFPLALCFLSARVDVVAVSRPELQFEVFQFSQNQIPRIDGDFSDWNSVPDSYAIGLDELGDTKRGRGTDLDPKDFDISVKVAWVKGLNRLYFLYEATDDYWDFDRPGIKNDIFEVVVDANLSGGPFIKHVNGNLNILPRSELHFRGHGEHAQNYHIFTPAKNKDWAMVWGNASWIKNFPYANAAYDYDFQHGEGGTLKMEFYITAFDHADYRGPAYSTESVLKEGSLIGLSWCILEYDDEADTYESFMNLSHDNEMVRNGSHLCSFKLMPVDSSLREGLDAQWSFMAIQGNPRRIAFEDQSYGKIDYWHWDFGDGSSSNERHPVHTYTKDGQWVVTLTVKGIDGESKRSKVWDVTTP